MRHPIVFDLTRMFVGAASRTPRGIDRVDMGYAREFLGEPDDRTAGLVPSWSGMGVLTRQEALRLTRVVEGHWTETRPPDRDAQFQWVKACLAGAVTAAPESPPTRGHEGQPAVLRYARMVLAAARSPLRTARRAVPHGAVYINTGQLLLGSERSFNWLDARPDVKPVFMMHDLIPVLFPEYSGPILSRHHERGLRTAAKRAAAMIATSQASGDEIREALAALGRRDLPIHVVPLPVSESLLAGRDGPTLPADPPYFVTVGNIDQRKNHLLLFHVWRDMLRRNPGRVPKLVIVGQAGLRTAGLLDALARSPGLAASVIVVSGLASQAMRELIRGARALLMPSYTEGFGLPVIEALALGTPVVASDIPAHREVGGTRAAYLDPLDGPGWRDEVLRRSEDSAAVGVASESGAYRVQTWDSYFRAVRPFLDTL